ncbi:hypothetical protein Sjap_010658 [Stephania japonica]|uniref:Uncharacterized protein n=1 Tax=Stephania japonica TaxID=461633 RepID=A0AAP0JBW2_9MAGN
METEGGAALESAAEGDTEAAFVGSEESQIKAVLEKIERCTDQSVLKTGCTQPWGVVCTQQWVTRLRGTRQYFELR